MKKLTLSAEDDVIAQAKQLARRNHTSVSSMFVRFVRLMSASHGTPSDLSPAARKATGIVSLPKNKTDRELLTEALAERHGVKR